MAASLLTFAPTTPAVRIFLENPQPTYTSHSNIGGTVSFTPARSTPFDEIQITLEGNTRTEIRTMTKMVAATHNFLRLMMPIPESAYPAGRTAEAGVTYRFSFNFAVPQKLLPTACRHKIANSNCLHKDHTQAPPSMGCTSDRPDDMSPETVKIEYAIKTKILHRSVGTGKVDIISQASRAIHIIPDSAEEPPLTFDLINNDYILQKSKSLKKNLFKGKLGTITMTSAQPAALRYFTTGPSTSSSPLNTKAPVHLRFDPISSDVTPPKLGNVSSRIRATTFYSAEPYDAVPSHASMIQSQRSTCSVYETSMTLEAFDMSAVKWEKQTASQATAAGGFSIAPTRDSGYCTPSESARSSLPELGPSSSQESNNNNNNSSGHNSQSRPCYTATAFVPINLPPTKTWLPSFNSCLLSRIYTLDMTLSVQTGAGVPSTTMTVRVPVQISSSSSEPSNDYSGALAESAQLDDLALLLDDTLDPATFGSAQHDDVLPEY